MKALIGFMFEVYVNMFEVKKSRSLHLSWFDVQILMPSFFLMYDKMVFDP